MRRAITALGAGA